MFKILIAVFAAMLWVTAAFAAGGPDFGRALLSRIESEGYRISSVKTTWLGRVKIDSSNARNRRQTVYNPANNAILQDLIIPLENGTFVQKLTSYLEGDVRARRDNAKKATSADKTASNQDGGSSGGGNSTSPSNTGNTGSGGGEGNSGNSNGKSGNNNGKSGNNNGKSGNNNGKSGTNNGKSDGGNSFESGGSNGKNGTKK